MLPFVARVLIAPQPGKKALGLIWRAAGAYSEDGDNCPMQLRRRVQTHSNKVLGTGDELGRHRRVHRPANHTAGEEIDDGGHIEPALRCPHIGEVSNPFAVGSGRFEDAVEYVGSDAVADAL